MVDAADAAAADIFVTPPPPAKITRRAAAARKGAAPRSTAGVNPVGGAPAGGAAPVAPVEDALPRSVADNTYVKVDGTSVMGGGLDMGRFGIRNVRDH